MQDLNPLIQISISPVFDCTNYNISASRHFRGKNLFQESIFLNVFNSKKIQLITIFLSLSIMLTKKPAVFK